ncbi:MAG: hypothetical protein UV59_C0029G0027 [Candidatus Gottesmanbacteria bacterium GW2011_GWA1_43_11]|uniref:Uncharacterized protein n=1 Tax=Candidatus Gottesmanbacteria bacterium GW2011_GWA1_43_11 TaxID=1618436 RepID=A0A0G1CE22_9BACT|nr:MAG: hypothetical protein UV59_C0029G0027 [Candidatus Gottesmanbacteria bacterium GW2011_GWA1_43_11]
MKKFMTKTFIVVIFLLLITFFGIYYISRKSSSSPVSIPTQTTNISEEVIEFEGKLTKFNDNCKVDASCEATVNGYIIITNPGDVQVSALGESDIWSDDIGKKVKVRAKRLDNKTLTLVGDSSLYVKLTE